MWVFRYCLYTPCFQDIGTNSQELLEAARAIDLTHFIVTL